MPNKTDSRIIGITADKSREFSLWYMQIVIRCEMLDYSDISGCYILRPTSMWIWNAVKEFLNTKFVEDGVQEVYFPFFVTKKALEKEREHVEGFEAEVAWITKCGGSDLQEPIAIRPTSETIIYPHYAKWIQSHRDLPLKQNQWCNVVRWEFSHPHPFIRSREFLWQEGHCVFNTEKEADENVMVILNFYQQVYEELLAVPVFRGKKSENERFAGSLYTTSIEAFIPCSGRAVQAATSHCLGQNFSKMFGVCVEAEEASSEMEKQKRYLWQTSWGLSTRSIGILTMIHADNKGLVLPPKIAQTQIVIVPCGLNSKTTTKEKEDVFEQIEQIKNKLTPCFRVKTDLRENYTPGWKFNHWELMGVPLRIEVGPRDVKKKEARVVQRVDGVSIQLGFDEIEKKVKQLLANIQECMFKKAREERDRLVCRVDTIEEALKNKEKIILAPWCEAVLCEKDIRQKTRTEKTDEDVFSSGIKSLCIPFDQPCGIKERKCFNCQEKAVNYAYFGRSY